MDGPIHSLQHTPPLTALGLYKNINEACLDWLQTWGLALAYGVTLSLDRAEKIAAEALVALQATQQRQRHNQDSHNTTSITATRFASILWELTSRAASRSPTLDEFSKLTPLARAAVILKVKARFSRLQIAEILKITVLETEDLLESARLGFTKGRPWLAVGPALGHSWEEGRLFARYLEHDVDPDQRKQLHLHFITCDLCRKSLTHFKNIYSDWLESLPQIEPSAETQKFFIQTARLAKRAAITPSVPSPVPGVRKLFKDRHVQIAILSFILMLFLHYYVR